MIWIANTLVAVVAALHVYFLILEMFLWTRPLGLKTFRNSIEKATESAVLAANQGLYNGFLAAGLIWGLFHPTPGFAFQIKVFFLLCVIVAGVYGAATVSRRILYVQAAPAALALICSGWRRNRPHPPPCIAKTVPPNSLATMTPGHPDDGRDKDHRHTWESSLMRGGIFTSVAGTALAVALMASPASAQKKYDIGASDTEIKFGQTVPFSGAYSVYANIGKTQAAYMRMINEQGGVQYDDAYSPPKEVVLDLSLPGMKINTGPNDYRVNKQFQMMKFNGERWELFGPILKDAGPAG